MISSGSLMALKQMLFYLTNFDVVKSQISPDAQSIAALAILQLNLTTEVDRRLAHSSDIHDAVEWEQRLERWISLK